MIKDCKMSSVGGTEYYRLHVAHLPGIYVLLFGKVVLLLSAYCGVPHFHSSSPVACGSQIHLHLASLTVLSSLYYQFIES